MKICPKCNLPSLNDEDSFCAVDGTPLISDQNDVPTVFLSSPNPSVKVRQGVSPFFAYLAIALIALIVGGGVVAWYKSGPDPANKSTVSSTTPDPAKTSTPEKPSPVPTATAPLPVPPPPIPPPKYMPFSPGLYQVVNTKGPSDPLYIRPGPGDLSRSNGSIPLGDTVRVLDSEQKRDKKGNLWVYVNYQGTTGWVHTRYLRAHY